MKIIELSESITEEIAQEIASVFSEAFGTKTSSDFLERVNEKQGLLVTLAYIEGELAGFKIGYTKYRGIFFSWLGAVLPRFHRKGIARALLLHQHLACSKLGYTEIQTETHGNNKGMLLLNIQEGFTIFGCHLGHNNEISVQLRK